MDNKRIFVSGGAGTIGHALVQALIEMHADVYVGDLKPCPKEWLGKIRYRQGDLNTLTSQELLNFDPEIFFHLAAPFERSQATFSSWREIFYHNTLLSHHLLNCLQDSSSLTRVLFASSYLIYDPRSYHFQNPSSIEVSLKEDAQIYPSNICGAAKLFHEYELKFLSSFFKDDLSFTSVRIFPLYSNPLSSEISHWIRSATRQETLTYCPQEKIDYISAENVAKGLIKLAKIDFDGTVNLGTGQSVSSQTIMAILKKHFPNLKTKEIPCDLSFQAFQANMELFYKLTGWNPSSDLEIAISKMIQHEHVESDIEACLGAILVTSISKKIPLLQAVRKAADKLGLFNSIHGCDSDQNCIGQYEVDEFWHTPLLHELTIENIISYCLEHRIKAIIPTRNADLEFYAKHHKTLQSQGIDVMVSSIETILLCVDKKRFADFLIENHFPSPPAFLTAQELKVGSCVVKERYGAGSIRIELNISKEQASTYAKHLNDPIFQPYIAGQEWSVDLYRSSQGRVMGCVARQRNLIVQGESQITTTASYPSLENLCKSVAHLLGIQGHAVIQVMEDEEGAFHIIECNPRFGGASTASLAVGLDSFYWFLLECCGQSLQGYPFIRSQQDVRQVRYAADWILPWSSPSI